MENNENRSINQLPDQNPSRQTAWKTHGMSRTPIYFTWKNMRYRCEDSARPDYYMYGGRGIKVCDRWQKFENFYEDMGDKPKNMSLDRIDNDGNYEPGNVKWRTPQEQSNNTRRNKYYVYKHKVYTVRGLAKLSRLSYTTIYQRIKRGWGISDTMSVPFGYSRKGYLHYGER